MNYNNYIPMNLCKDGYLYETDGRNLGLGIFCKKDSSFIYLRYKWGSTFIDQEYHWDTGAPYGTCKPLKELEFFESTENNTLTEDKVFKYLKNVNKKYNS